MGAGSGENELVTRPGEPRAVSNRSSEEVDDRAHARLDPAARVAHKVLVAPCGDTVLSPPVVDGHARDLIGRREPGHRRRGAPTSGQRHATTPGVFLELVERPVETGVAAHRS